MPFKKGQKRPAKAGRKKGTPNKATASVKEALEAAFDGLGGVDELIAWAKRTRANRTIFYRDLWAKLLPTQIKAEHTGPGGGPMLTEIVIEHHAAAAPVQPADDGDGRREAGGPVPPGPDQGLE